MCSAAIGRFLHMFSCTAGHRTGFCETIFNPQLWYSSSISVLLWREGRPGVLQVFTSDAQGVNYLCKQHLHQNAPLAGIGLFIHSPTQ